MASVNAPAAAGQREGERMAPTEVPMVDLARAEEPLRDELRAAFDRVLDHRGYCLGPEVDAFEEEVADALGCAHAVAVNSGTDALDVGLQALGVRPGDRVLVPALSFWATASVPARLGAVPVFCDVDDDLLMDPASAAERSAAGETPAKAAVPVHLYGRPADLEALRSAFGSADTAPAILEDAAQAFGSAGTGGGDAAAWSFYPTKTLGALGDAGLLTTDDDQVAATARSLRVHGQEPDPEHRYRHSDLGLNSRMDGLQAAALRVKLPHLPAWNEERRAIAGRYRDGLAALEEAGDLRLPRAHDAHVHHQFTLRTERRDDLLEHLRAAGVGAAVFYPVPLHRCGPFADGTRPAEFADESACPRAERAAEEVLSLPCFVGMTPDEQDRVVDGVRSFFQGRSK